MGMLAKATSCSAINDVLRRGTLECSVTMHVEFFDPYPFQRFDVILPACPPGRVDWTGRTHQKRRYQAPEDFATMFVRGKNNTHWFQREQTMEQFDRITFDPQIMGGRACIRGMRIPVSVIVNQIAHGATFDGILEGYPDLAREDIEQALDYAAWLTTEQVINA